jgi:hypothetical protein
LAPAARGAMANASLPARFGTRRYTRDERRPRGEAGAFKETSQSRDQGALDAPNTSPKHKSGKALIATALPTGSRKTLHPSDNRHCASSAKNTHENRVAAIQRKAKTNTCEQRKSDQLP